MVLVRCRRSAKGFSALRPGSKTETKARRPGAGSIVPVEPIDSGAAGSSALQKGFSLLEHLIAADRALTLAELVAQMDMPKATVHRLLINLEAAELLKRDLTGKRYVPGDRLARFSLRAVVFSARMSPVRAILERLVAEIGESINLGVLDGSSVAYVQRVECNWPLRTHLSAGSRVPLHCTATGKLFLALMPTARRTALLDEIELKAYSPNTITSRKRLDEELARIRDERMAVNNEEFMVGATGLSVPLIGIDGEMIAGLALHAPVARLSVDDVRAHASTLRRAAEKLARTLL
jgi:IclR family transcriptional regulator, acetate operon repressor